MTFAVRLLGAFFTPSELKGKNVSGMGGKEQLDPERIAKIKKLCISILSHSTIREGISMAGMPKAIDSYLRKAFPHSS